MVGGVLVESCWPLAALVTVVAMSTAAVGTSGSPMLGMRGRTGVFESWRVSLGWWACAPWLAGLPEVVLLGDLALGAVGVLDGLALPEMRLESVGLGLCGLTMGAGVTGALGDSVVGVVVARGIGGSS